MVLGYLLLGHPGQVKAIEMADARHLGNQHDKYNQPYSEQIGAGEDDQVKVAQLLTIIG